MKQKTIKRTEPQQLSRIQADKLIAEQVAQFNSTRLRKFAAETIAKRSEKSPVQITLVLCWGCNQHEADGSGYCETCSSKKEAENRPVDLRRYALTAISALTGIVLALVVVWAVQL